MGYKVGAELIKQAASKMNDVAGDGTTTVTVLTYHILNEANKLIAAGHNPMLLRKGLEQASEEILKELKGMREDIAGDKSVLLKLLPFQLAIAPLANLLLVSSTKLVKTV